MYNTKKKNYYKFWAFRDIIDIIIIIITNIEWLISTLTFNVEKLSEIFFELLFFVWRTISEKALSQYFFRLFSFFFHSFLWGGDIFYKNVHNLIGNNNQYLFLGHQKVFLKSIKWPVTLPF